eukprot:COSAG06_NODE_8667_length_2101_cov_5.590909_1_plen_156_part_00
MFTFAPLLEMSTTAGSGSVYARLKLKLKICVLIRPQRLRSHAYSRTRLERSPSTAMFTLSGCTLGSISTSSCCGCGCSTRSVGAHGREQPLERRCVHRRLPLPRPRREAPRAAAESSAKRESARSRASNDSSRMPLDLLGVPIQNCPASRRKTEC